MSKTKQGVIFSHEKSKQRRSDLIAAEKAKEINEGKVLVPVWGAKKPTHVMVPRSQVDQYLKKYRKAQAKDPANARKVEFLKSKGWRMKEDGIWMNRFEFLHKDFEAALITAKYYEHLQKAYEIMEG